MGEIISFVGQKGGTGKSTLARAFAAKAAHAKNVLIADLDDGQRTSWEWGKRRAANDCKPPVAVETVPRLQVFTRAASVDLLVVDAPGWADAATLWLAQGSQLTVLPTGGSIDDLNPTIRLMHELSGKGIAEWRLALVLCRMQNEAENAFARSYLKQAGYKALKGELHERKSFRDLQNGGHSITESPVASLALEATELIHSIEAALVRALKRTQEEERAHGGRARLVGPKERDSR